jgi:hypothetical protein
VAAFKEREEWVRSSQSIRAFAESNSKATHLSGIREMYFLYLIQRGSNEKDF